MKTMFYPYIIWIGTQVIIPKMYHLSVLTQANSTDSGEIFPPAAVLFGIQCLQKYSCKGFQSKMFLKIQAKHCKIYAK